MRAWRLPRLGDPWTELAAVDMAEPTAKEATSLRSDAVVVRVEATDLNFADILQCRGQYQVRHEVPFTPGMNAAGTVVDSPPGSPHRIGKRIVGPTVAPRGGFAECAVLAGDLAHPVPEGVSSIDAMAAHITFGTAWFALHHRGRLQPGETVLVLAGAGGVGSAAVRMARAHGCWVAAAAGGSEKAAICRDLGADAVIDYEAEDLYATVMELTNGRGVDVIFDPVGGDWSDTARRLLAWEGRLLVIGFASGRIPSAPANHVLVKNYAVIGVHMGGYRERRIDLVRECYADLHGRLERGEIKPFVSEVIDFDAVPQALRRLSERQTTGRVVFDPHR
ncbi:MAG: NADPH:quinone oxidoreductase family protein [Gammaproteobacteria bacterium]|nr:NADPH:quinone oxidoreductase family protein [Gammaproteobacteria bacterium]